LDTEEAARRQAGEGSREVALLMCPECGNEVSSNAETCPRCGNPTAHVAAGEVRAIGTPVKTIQKTSKRLKLHKLISGLILIGGLIFFIVVINQKEQKVGESTLAILLCLIGFIWSAVTQIRIWWHHG
jgi:uncharacterized OB-fold protein